MSAEGAVSQARSAHILVVDNDPSIRNELDLLFTSRGLKVDTATTGEAALRAFEHGAPDLILLELCLPSLDGDEVCRRVRAQSNVPIIILSARSSESDKIAALDHGADDYVTKPFSHEELLARVRVALRRVFKTTACSRHVLRGDLAVDFEQRRVLRGATSIRLTPKEFDLLAYFVRRPNQVLTHRSILTAVWGPHAANHPEHVWVLVGQLRKKLERDPAHPELLINERWIGYQLVTDRH